ncbi:rab11 family-interacting protein 4A isoform X2 [Papilio machaon]|uniref:rab11 family-interacting protein 4A isoform X2 n=1 Tax=Papilio machaon TaxID=76193 RepID=UPI001E664DD3|nr:rab11 family-interacting protein 4A isoform X2 [Papilio machaon]
MGYLVFQMTSLVTSMSEVVFVLRSDLDVAGVLETWWRGLVLLARFLITFCRLLNQTLYELKAPVAVMMAPSVFQRPQKSPRSSPGNLPRKLQNGTESTSQSEPTADSSPGNSISDAENFECYGEADGDTPINTLENGSRSPANPLNRHSWTRTSLRRTPPSSGKRQIGSNVLASQLYRSSSFNSSGCGSGGEPADDMYSDVSLEEDVQGLNYKVQLLQQQVTSLADTQSTADDRYARVKADKAVLQARVHMLEEQFREMESRCEERIAEEQRRHREAIARVERDRDAQLAALADRLAAAENEASDLKQEVGRLRGVAETLRANSEMATRAQREAQEAVGELTAALASAREAERRERAACVALRAQLAAAQRDLDARDTAPPPPDPDPRLDELREELVLLRNQNRSLCEAQEELQAQLLTRGVEAGRSLLHASSPLLEHSLAHELSQMTDHELVGSTQSELSIELEKLQKALKEQQDVNVQLRAYIDGILLSIVENYPQLLEVKYQKPEEKS